MTSSNWSLPAGKHKPASWPPWRRRGRTQLLRTAGQVAIVILVGLLLGGGVVATRILPTDWAALIVAGLIAVSLIPAMRNMQRFLLGIAILDIPLNLDINFFYDERMGYYNAVGGLGISLTTVCVVLLYVLWFFEVASAEEKPEPYPLGKWPLLLPLAYLGFVVLSMLVADNVVLSLFQLFLLVEIFLLYWYVATHVRTREDVAFVIVMLFFGVIAESVVIIALRFIGETIEVAGIMLRADGSRIGGTVGGPNGAGAYYALLLAPAMSVFLFVRKKNLLSLLGLVATGLGTIALFFTLSRGAWLGFAASVAVLFVFAWWAGWLSPRFLLLLFLAIAVAAGLHQTILARLLGDDEGAAESRVHLMALAWRMIRAHPLLGVGANNFAWSMFDYLTPEFSSVWLRVVHNRYMAIWAETGIGGLATFLAFLAAALKRAYDTWLVDDGFLSPIALGLGAGLVGYMTHMTVDLFNGRPTQQLMWLSAGLLMAIAAMLVRERNEQEAAPQPDPGRAAPGLPTSTADLTA